MRLFAAARDAAGASAVTLDAQGDTVDEVLDRLCTEHGALTAVLACSRVWVNGDEPAAGGATVVHDGDEIAVLPPVSGGAESPRDLAGNLGPVNQLFPRRIDRVLDPEYLASIEDETLDRLHAMLDECLQIETETAYVRQLAQGRIQILDAEQNRRASGGSVADLVAALPRILSGGDTLPDPVSSRLPRYLAPASKIEFKRGLETYVSDETLATLPALPDADLADRLAKLRQLENEASSRRAALAAVIDRLEAAIAARVTAGT